ncbi:hypothetical protein OJ252_1127 [Cryptosporidium canis]|uniref:Protein phosphatase inhibitor 2 n=1 Tax=Cryptosporidium canis TaxID=195482 RepID=A0ABQ8P8Y1_9CRYT|nr:hypothetical protein OJ252_1127 [Cryptosporidium canis]
MSQEGGSGILPRRSKNGAKVSKGITWDEETIAMHDIERGTRMEINEPDTPYYYGSPSDSDEGESNSSSQSKQTPQVDLNELSSRLFEYADQVDESVDPISSSNLRNECPSPDQKSKQDTFREKRRLHYKEFITAKSLLCRNVDSDSEPEIND